MSDAVTTWRRSICRRSARRAWSVAGTVIALVLTQAGCVTSKKYKMVKPDRAVPVQVLDWKASGPAAEVTLQAVIVFKGPGSWKREARWDEYVVTLANRGAEPFVIDYAAVVDVLGVPREWGVDPWQLEKLSYSNWDKYGKTGLTLVAGTGAVVAYSFAAATAISFGEGGFMAGAGGAGASAGAGAALLILPIAAVVDVTAVAIMNNQNRKKVVAEFNRRRLPLPLTLAPAQVVSGSWFFPMTPGPQRLVMRGHQGGQPVTLALDLKPFAGLHLAPDRKTTPP